MSKESIDTVQSPMGAVSPGGEASHQLRLVHPRSEVHRLGAKTMVVGRKPDPKGLTVEHGTVSRRHVELRRKPDGSYTVDELGSRNGSRLNGRRLTPGAAQPLTPGDVLRTGDVIWVMEATLSERSAPSVSREAIFGRTPAMVRLRAEVAQAAHDPSPVLLIGETGTGKEYAAREIHRLSGREGPFVAINCAALSPQLVESQLFGHRKGAFTGADTHHDGLFRAADGGTLFLDEVGELPLSMQPKLLRVLQEREVLPVGATRAVPVDVRVVSATLRDLARQAEAGSFRLDLYARLSPWEVRIPALRERRGDLVAWFERLTAAWFEAREREHETPALGADDLERLLLHDWPDNLRGLDRVVHRLCSGGGLELPRRSVPPERSSGEHAAASAPESRPAKPSAEELAAVLEANDGSIRATAKHYQRDRRQIYRWLEQYGLKGE